MGKIIFLFLCFVTTGALAGEACEYANIVNELKENCGGINTELRQIKQLSTANVAVTGVGTAAAGGALYAGIKKKDFDERAEKLIQSMQRIDNMSNDEFMGFLGDMVVYQEAKNNYKNACMMKRMYQSKAKKMGDLRTGLMAGNTATAVAGTVVSSKNKKGAESIVDMIQQCLDTIKNNEQKIGQAKIDCEKNQYEKLDEAVSYCKKLSTENMEKVSKQNKTSAIISGLNIGTGTAGTITSAFANKKEYDDKNKKLNTMANVFAGTSALASGVSTVFNAATLKSINNNLQVAISCEEALNNL